MDTPPASVPTPPLAEAFEVSYYVTDAGPDLAPGTDPAEVRLMSVVDFGNYVNAARCECRQKIGVRVRLKPDSYAPGLMLRSYVGVDCPTAEADPTAGTPRCLSLGREEPSFFVEATRRFFIDPIWFATGPTDAWWQSNGTTTPIPRSTCTDLEGTAGFWICKEHDGACAREEDFAVRASDFTPRLPVVKGLSFDFRPPTGAPRQLDAQAGDEVIQLSWQPIAGDIAGYRILCAKDGEPIPGHAMPPPHPTDERRGTAFFTVETVCGQDPTAVPGVDDEEGGTGASPTEGDTTDDATSADATEADPTDTGTSSTDTSSTDTSSTDTSSTDTSGTDTEGPGLEPIPGWATGLPWRYVCTDHIAPSAGKIRIKGLENLTEYQFVLVAYDRAGNGIASAAVVAKPFDTRGLWEQCEAQDEACGDGGFCAVAPVGPGGVVMMGGSLVALVVVRRARARNHPRGRPQGGPSSDVAFAARNEGPR